MVLPLAKVRGAASQESACIRFKERICFVTEVIGIYIGQQKASRRQYSSLYAMGAVAHVKCAAAQSNRAPCPADPRRGELAGG
jgi:hypothetical protein